MRSLFHGASHRITRPSSRSARNKVIAIRPMFATNPGQIGRIGNVIPGGIPGIRTPSSTFAARTCPGGTGTNQFSCRTTFDAQRNGTPILISSRVRATSEFASLVIKPLEVHRAFTTWVVASNPVHDTVATRGAGHGPEGSGQTPTGDANSVGGISRVPLATARPHHTQAMTMFNPAANSRMQATTIARRTHRTLRGYPTAGMVRDLRCGGPTNPTGV